MGATIQDGSKRERSNIYQLFSLLLFHIFKKRVKILKILILFIYFVNNGLFISQEKYLNKNNTHLFCSYNITSSLLEQFGLIIEYGKTKVFHFSRLYSIFNPPPLNLSQIEGPILCSKES